MKSRRLRRLLRRTLLALAIIVFVLPPTALLLYRLVPPPATPLMLIRLAEGHGMDYRWRPLEAIAPALPAAVLAAEDNRFCRHWGIDWQAVEQAWAEFRNGGRLRGASTVSMQTAKNLFLWPGRSWLRKGLEAYLVLWVELLWDKQRIIEVYLNIAEFGPGLYGAEAAAQHWFGRPADGLSRLQAARLAVLLPDPLDRSAVRPTPRLARIAQTVAARSTQIAPLLDCYN
ncbi:MAG: monofunctional biosynthetic peptidoglycan transglycosylase [Alphaproteobacteria bacterium]|jgi:monofunctional biosynthetic peptidoglycan transglycosylase|nr:monofunctional biosynthetic peptidoglycan transglycosylase [Alphaproteobacteria bacterium]